MDVYKLIEDDGYSGLLQTDAPAEQVEAAIEFVKTVDDYSVEMLVAVLKATGYAASDLQVNITKVIHW